MSFIRDYAYTGDAFNPQEALDCGLVNRVFETKEDCLKGALEMAKTIASKSPSAIYATK